MPCKEPISSDPVLDSNNRPIAMPSGEAAANMNPHREDFQSLISHWDKVKPRLKAIIIL